MFEAMADEACKKEKTIQEVLLECVEDLLDDFLQLNKFLNDNIPEKVKKSDAFKEFFSYCEGDFIILDKSLFESSKMIDRSARVLIPDVGDDKVLVFHFQTGPIRVTSEQIVGKIPEPESKRAQVNEFLKEVLYKIVFPVVDEDTAIN